MCISSDEPTFLLKFMQDPLSLLQLIAEPRAIIRKRQDLSLIFVLHYIFFFFFCQRLQHEQRWTA